MLWRWSPPPPRYNNKLLLHTVPSLPQKRYWMALALGHLRLSAKPHYFAPSNTQQPLFNTEMAFDCIKSNLCLPDSTGLLFHTVISPSSYSTGIFLIMIASLSSTETFLVPAKGLRSAWKNVALPPSYSSLCFPYGKLPHGILWSYISSDTTADYFLLGYDLLGDTRPPVYSPLHHDL